MKKLPAACFLALVGCTGSVSAASVAAVNGQTFCSNYESINVLQNGNVVIANCITPASSSAAFSVGSTSYNANAGSSVVLNVLRTISGSGVAGTDTVGLSLIEATGGLAATFSSASLNFSSSDTTKQSSVTFTGTGTGKISLNVNGTASAASSSVYNIASLGSCTSTPLQSFGQVITLVNNGPTGFGGDGSGGSGGWKLIPGNSTERAAASFTFQVPTVAPASKYWVFKFNDAPPGYPSRVNLETTVSQCSGDFSPTQSVCKSASSFTLGPVISLDTTYCQLTPGQDYHLNVRVITPGESAGFLLQSGVQ